jgi:hypothetical protein
MSYADYCRDCHPGRFCDHHRALSRKHARDARARRAPLQYRQCFRCLGFHANGERHCPLAAEYEPLPMEVSL